MVGVTEMTNWAVDLIDVRKTYPRGVQALRGVNIQVGRGEIFGLLGPNGAGKTTLVKIMMTAVRPTRAFGTILGRPIGHRGKLAVTGYLPENHRFPGYLKGRQLLDYYAALAKVPKSVRRERAPKLLELVGLSQWADMRIDKYSKGMAQRLGIAQALMNDPELIVLDEPTDGLDPVGRRDVRTLLLELRKQGKTVFLNSHLLSELEMVCDRVAILVNGLVARQGTLRDLTDRTVDYRITFSGDAKPLADKLRQMGAKLDGTVITISGHDLRKVNMIVDMLRGAGALVESVQPHKFSLEDILVEAVGLRMGAAEAASMPSVPPMAQPVPGKAAKR